MTPTLQEGLGHLIAKCAAGIFAAVVLIALARIISVDGTRPQGFDEPAHIAAGMEWLQFHTYRLDPLHPPLARVATAFPLYLSRMRFREATSSLLPGFWDAGNSLLFQGSYLKNLRLARLGVLPFFAVLLAVTFLWTWRQFGIFAGLIAAVLISTLPVVLTFASLAYTDLPAACLQLCCILAFAEWLEKPSWSLSATVGALFGLAALTKFTSLIYVPVAGLVILLFRHLLTRRATLDFSPRPRLMPKAVTIALVTLVIVWGGYRFSVGPMNEVAGISTNSVPSFQHFPRPVRGLAKNMVTAGWRIPAPSFFAGIAQAWVMNKTTPDAYLMGRIRPGGWWYFFFVEALFKTPLPFLLLLIVACFPLYRKAVDGYSRPLVPAIAAFGIAAITTTVSVNFGLRHVLVLFPLLAVMAGCGAKELWDLPLRAHLGKALVLILVGWQCVAALRPGTDWIGYFNELAGQDPSRLLVTGCDLDCGQDVLNLSHELRHRNVEHVALALWTSADLNHMELPQFGQLEPFRPTSGWVAVSLRAVREGSVQHQEYPPNAFSWLEEYKPVTYVGSTITLYYIPQVEEVKSVASAR